MARTKGEEDHDLLIGLDQKVDDLIGKVTGGLLDHEARLRKVERDGQRYKGAVAALLFIGGLIEPILIFLKGSHKWKLCKSSLHGHQGGYGQMKWQIFSGYLSRPL